MPTRETHLITLLALAAASVAAATPAAAQAEPSKWSYSFHVGSAHPLDTLDALSDANIHVDVDLTYLLGKRTDRRGYFNAKLFVGLNQFTAESATGLEHPRWLNASVNLQAVLGSGALRPYVQAGSGIYWPKSGPSKVGLNLGLGLQAPVNSSLALEFGMDIHQVQTKPATRFWTAQLGVLFH